MNPLASCTERHFSAARLVSFPWLFCGALLVGTVLLTPAYAGGPLLVSEDGNALRWSVAGPVVIRPDRGTLGAIADPVAILQLAAQEWSDVDTSSLELEVGVELGIDIEGLSVEQFRDLIEIDDGTNPIIFDDSGAIFEALFGANSGVLGVAGPSLVIPSIDQIVKGYAMFNGAAVAPNEERIVRAAMTHELGHFLNLDHSQINGVHIDNDPLDNNPATPVPGFPDIVAELVHITTMFPLLKNSNADPHPMSTLHTDDVAALSTLYPSVSFENRGRIEGLVLDFDGETLLPGVNVVARNINNPLNDAVSFVSGEFDPGLDPELDVPSIDPLTGFYELTGLTAGAQYRLYIEEIDRAFFAGSSVGPVDPPIDYVPNESHGFLEFFSGASEGATDPPDDPTSINGADVAVSAGATVVADFIFNGVVPRVTAVSPSSGSYTAIHPVNIGGANFEQFVRAQLVGPTVINLTNANAIDSTLIEAIIPAFRMPGQYEVVVSNNRGSSVGGEQFRITEPDPVLDSMVPNGVTNIDLEVITFRGNHLLGTAEIRLIADGLPDLLLDILSARVVAAPDTEAVVEAVVPLGGLPGTYGVTLSNTNGTISPAGLTLRVVELEPNLAGEVEPDVVLNSQSTDVRIRGDNLSGTQGLELSGDGGVFPLTIKSTSLNEVIVTVPAGLPAGTYIITLSNTVGEATGTAELTVQPNSGGGGGGGGCGALPTGSGETTGHPDLVVLLVLLVALRWTLRRQRPVAQRG